jgi:hypothetical protein
MLEVDWKSMRPRDSGSGSIDTSRADGSRSPNSGHYAYVCICIQPHAQHCMHSLDRSATLYIVLVRIFIHARTIRCLEPHPSILYQRHALPLKELSFGLVFRVHEYARGLQIAVSDRGGRHVVAMIKLEDIE